MMLGLSYSDKKRNKKRRRAHLHPMQMPQKPLNLVPSGSKPPLCGKHIVKQLLKNVAKILPSVK